MDDIHQVKISELKRRAISGDMKASMEISRRRNESYRKSLEKKYGN
jgi:hypothetical protein